jgi:hypothetical protein
VTDRVTNRRDPGDLTEADVEAALARIAQRDREVGEKARHVYDALTWGEGPAQLHQAGVQDWLWYRLPTKYLTDEAGYMGRLASVAAVLFDELGLDGYAAVCRSDATAAVHAGFDRSEAEGFKAMRRAREASGIEPPELADLTWGQVMGVEEAQAHAAVEVALERAISSGELLVGGRGWRERQRQVTARTLDTDHPYQPGQSWRTAILTERIGTWVDDAMRCEALGRLRARVSNRLLQPVPAPPDVAQLLAPLTWLLEVFGDEQPLTQAGYLNRSFVVMVHHERPWDEPFPSRRPPRSETDEITLHRLRDLLTSMGALRKRGRSLHRTRRGATMAADATVAWAALVDGLGARPWERFVVESVGLLLLDRGTEVPASDVYPAVSGFAADLGWRTAGPGGAASPSERDVQWAFSDARAALELFGMLDEFGDWADRRYRLTPAGEAALLTLLRTSAAGPRERPW